ncbi:MAG: family 10 glycosylhydrolase, partial [Bacteroidota bacterium]
PVSAQPKNELRAVWMTNVASNVLTSDQNIVEAMDYLASIGINVVFPVVYNSGYTLYPSKIMNDLFGVAAYPSSAYNTRDFLDRLVIEAHRNGIEVIPWFEYGFSTSYSANGGHILAKYPSWALKDNAGALIVDNGFDWMSPLNPAPQNFMLSLMTEVMDNYNVDGVQGDDRLPAMPVEGGYDSATVALYKIEHLGANPPSSFSDADWMRWRADKLTEFLGRVRDSVKVRGKNMILSVSPAPYYWGYAQLLQDSKSWVQQGLLDNVIPQLYQYNIGDFNYALNTTWNDVGQYGPNVFSSGILARVGSYNVDTTFLGQMMNAGRTKGAKGECFFFYEGIRANSNRVGTYLKNNFYQTSAAVPFRNGKVWIPKAAIVNETDAGVAKNGVWSEYLMKGYSGSIIRASDSVKNAELRYSFTVPASAFYDVYTYRTPNTPWTKNARYTLISESDSSSVIVDQSDLVKKGWFKLGTVYLTAGNRTALKLDNSLIEPGKYVVADAAMLMINRRRSPDVVLGVNAPQSERTSIPQTAELSRNYPNPFNPTTQIEYTIAEKGEVQVSVYDLLGRQTAILVNEQKGPGTYSLRFDAHGLASGTYFYSLRTNSEIITRRMVLIK